ncbi:hypothetical protein GIB67_039556 [Kingdonia uniflora]|uniref:Uncharacterized protein n=1 Tax=Kingdonia uniflora TaxID=39325 RepID=A0A7J7PAG4_9MAGN|nr:hypothetical protein GIB67_039556 [Kingdonia uniflora]
MVVFGAKEHDSGISGGSGLNNSSTELGMGLRDHDTVKFPSVKGAKMRPSASGRPKRKWNSREERRIDREYDVVLVPSDGGCMSGSESDDSDWSIGWMEPHAPDFQSDDERESSFAVLVPCYGRGRKELVDDTKNQLFGAIGDLTNGYSAGIPSYFSCGHKPPPHPRKQEVYGAVAFFSAEQLADVQDDRFVF